MYLNQDTSEQRKLVKVAVRKSVVFSFLTFKFSIDSHSKQITTRSEETVADKPKQAEVSFPPATKHLNGRMFHQVVLEDIMRLYVLCWRGAQGVCWVCRFVHGQIQYVLSLVQCENKVDFCCYVCMLCCYVMLCYVTFRDVAYISR